MIRRQNTTHIVLHTAAAKRKKQVQDNTSADIHDTWKNEDQFDGQPKEQWVAVDQSARQIHHYHVNKKGWDDIGYHYVIRFDGTLEKGRPEHFVGAHCRHKGMNSKSIGICLSGHGDIKPATEAQLSALGFIVYRLLNHYDIPLYNVIGHRETGAPKTCPGTQIDMDKIRNYLDAWEIIEITSADLQTEFENHYGPYEN